MLNRSTCPACNSRYVAYVQDVLGRRTGKRIPQYTCLDCRSFFNHSGYRESDEQKKADFDFLHNLREGIYANQNRLCLELVTRCPHVQTVCEIGYGLGWFLRSCNDYGRRAYGFETNANCHAYATGHLGLNCALGLFDGQHAETYDLFASIMVFEHLEQPRSLFKLMRDRLKPDGAIYLCVPFMERRDWPFLWTAGSDPGSAPPDVFYDNDVHIMHYSVEGLSRMGLSLGARTADYFVSPDVAHHSPGAYQGILFRF